MDTFLMLLLIAGTAYFLLSANNPISGIVTAFGFILLFAFILGSCLQKAPAAETWKKDTYSYETYRSDKGQVVKKDRYGYDTWRSNSGGVCKADRYSSGSVTCK